MQSSSSTDAPTGTPPSSTPSSLYTPPKDPWATMPPAENKPGKLNSATHNNSQITVAPPRSSHLPKPSSPFGHSYRPPHGQGISPFSPSPSSLPPSPSLRPASYLDYSLHSGSDRISFGPPTSSLRIPPEEELRTTDGERFTHIVKLSTLKDQSQSPVIQHYVASHETRVLNLGVSSNSPNSPGFRMRILTSQVDGVPLRQHTGFILITETSIMSSTVVSRC
ncbi:hypothetical protein EV359DRAFT_81519 [Lentinula novae-zelandiae]|nr:hypothetical protein EV359DRAFT_81519 [Lentinula novae-zelandiae]